MLNHRHLYTLILWLLLPYVFFHLIWRARKQPAYLKHIGERFGFYKIQIQKPVIWLHTVSVGETRAAASLIQRLKSSYPNHQILLTHTTPTGRETSEQLYGDTVERVYLPYDYSFAVEHFLNHFKPTVGVLLETEIWFNLIHHCHQQNISLLLLNARLSEKSAKGYGRFAKLSSIGLSQLNAIAAQTQEDANRLATLGGKNISIMGNLKYDITPPLSMLEKGGQLRQLFGNNRPIFLAASTRVGEEALLLDAIKQLDIPSLLTVIVPRHPQRFEEVAALLKIRHIPFQRRSANSAITAETKVVLGDSMGEMFAYYVACDIAYIGGSLLPFGGQNLIEACAVGKPIIIGPHTYNFTQASELAVASGAAKRVKNVTELAETLQHLFNNKNQLTQIGEAGISFVKSNQGATERALAIIKHTVLP